MQAVAIGWQVYDVARETRSIEESALMLGFVGLAQFAPVFLLSLVGGQAADRLDRRLILIVTNVVRVICARALAASPFFSGPVQLWIVFTAAIILGCMHAFSPAAASALLRPDEGGAAGAAVSFSLRPKVWLLPVAAAPGFC